MTEAEKLNLFGDKVVEFGKLAKKIGRASCRERV